MGVILQIMRDATARESLKKEMSTPATRRGFIFRVSSVKTRDFLRASCSADQVFRTVRCSRVNMVSELVKR